MKVVKILAPSSHTTEIKLLTTVSVIACEYMCFMLAYRFYYFSCT